MLGQGAEEQFLGVGVDLGAESASDVGGDEVDLRALSSVGCDEVGLVALCALRREPLDEGVTVPHRSRRTDFERARGDPLVDEATGDGDLAVGEELVGVGVLGDAQCRRVEDAVRSGGLVDQGVGGECRLDVDEGGQEVVVDEHHLGGVGGLLMGFGDDHGDGFADVADLVARQQRASCRRVERRRDRFEPERLGGVDRKDAGHVDCGLDVDRLDRGVGDHRSDEHRMGRALETRVVDVVGVDAARRQELRIFLALNARPQNACTGHVVPLVSRVSGPFDPHRKTSRTRGNRSQRCTRSDRWMADLIRRGG